MRELLAATIYRMLNLLLLPVTLLGYVIWISCRRIQAVEASASTSSMNNSEGFFQLWILRGRSLMSQATIAR